jgi:hypothetical protein
MGEVGPSLGREICRDILRINLGSVTLAQSVRRLARRARLRSATYDVASCASHFDRQRQHLLFLCGLAEARLRSASSDAAPLDIRRKQRLFPH